MAPNVPRTPHRLSPLNRFLMRRRPLLTYFVLCFAITWSIGGAAVLAPDFFRRTFGELTSAHPLFFVAVYTPSAVSLVLTWWFEGTAGLKRLAERLDPRRCNPVWYLVVFGGFVIVPALVGWASGTPPTWQFAGAIGLGAALLRDAGPLGEELGWRGFALPRMLERWSPPTACAILGVIWGIWHLPAFFLSGLEQSRIPLWLFMLGAVALSFVMGWLFLKTRGSVLIAMLSHLMANHNSDINGSSFAALTWGLVAVTLLLFALGQFARTPPEATAVGRGMDPVLSKSA